MSVSPTLKQFYKLYLAIFFVWGTDLKNTVDAEAIRNQDDQLLEMKNHNWAHEKTLKNTKTGTFKTHKK